MSIANILVHVEPGLGSEARLRYALSLARSFEAELAGISITVPPTEVAFAMMGDARLYNVAVEAASESSAASKALFMKVTEGSGVATRWCDAAGIPEEVMAAHAGCNDLVVVGREDKAELEGGFYTLHPADVILTCGRPVLVLPDDAPPCFYGDRILVAWRNTPEAGRAIHDALPFLTRATEVILAEVTRTGGHLGQPAVTINDMAEHLRAHGVPITTKQFVAEDGAAGERLVAAATEIGVDMIAAGGYGHSRFREWVLGGVTRTLLHSGAIPCLLSH